MVVDFGTTPRGTYCDFMLALLAWSALSIQGPPPAPREFRAVWIATVDNIDWPSKRTLTTDQAKAELVAILDKAQQLRLNAVIFQVRPHADALYESSIEPWSEYFTGAQGKRPAPYFDPLAFVVEEGHKRSLEVHAWFNPYRAWHPSAKSEPAPNYIGKTNPGLVKQIGKYQWMDPGEKEVQQRTRSVMLDVARRYDIDGIQIDDYFYPYPSYDPGRPFPDEPSWQKYLAAGGRLGRDDWRRKNVDDFVQSFYKALKRTKPLVKFGISPFGIYRPGQPPDVKTTFDQYAMLYADARKWLVEGWVDYLSPQLYWRVQSPQPYSSLLNWWIANNPKGRHLWPGLFTGQVGPSLGNWPVSEIVQQVELTRASGKATGNIHFSMRAFTQKWKNVDEALASSVYALPALVPASPWLDKTPPKAVRLRLVQAGGRLRAVLDGAVARDVWQIAFYELRNGKWALAEVLPRSADGRSVSPGSEAIAVSAVDRAGNESPSYVVRLPR